MASDSGSTPPAQTRSALLLLRLRDCEIARTGAEDKALNAAAFFPPVWNAAPLDEQPRRSAAPREDDDDDVLAGAAAARAAAEAIVVVAEAVNICVSACVGVVGGGLDSIPNQEFIKK